MLLPEIAKAGIPEKLGFENIYDYALKVGGLPFSTVARALRLKKRLEDLPKLYDAIEKVGISKVEIVARVANKETEDFWADKALNMSRAGVETGVKEEIFHTGVKFEGESRPCFAAPEKVKISLSAEAQKSFNRLKKQMGIGVGVNANEKAMEIILKKLEEYVGRFGGVKELESLGTKLGVGCVKEVDAGGVECVGGVKVVESGGTNGTGMKEKSHANLKKQESKKKITRQASTQEKREVEKRSEKICEYPGCTKAIENLHHKERFANKKSHKTLIALCKVRHEIVHNGFIINELDEVIDWRSAKKTMNQAN